PVTGATPAGSKRPCCEDSRTTLTRAAATTTAATTRTAAKSTGRAGAATTVGAFICQLLAISLQLTASGIHSQRANIFPRRRKLRWIGMQISIGLWLRRDRRVI